MSNVIGLALIVVLFTAGCTKPSAPPSESPAAPSPDVYQQMVTEGAKDITAGDLPAGITKLTAAKQMKSDGGDADVWLFKAYRQMDAAGGTANDFDRRQLHDQAVLYAHNVMRLKPNTPEAKEAGEFAGAVTTYVGWADAFKREFNVSTNVKITKIDVKGAPSSVDLYLDGDVESLRQRNPDTGGTNADLLARVVVGSLVGKMGKRKYGVRIKHGSETLGRYEGS